MSKSLIQTANTATQNAAVNSVIAPGTVLRRFGCNCFLSGNGIVLSGTGYYQIDAAVTFTNAAAGPVSFAVYQNGVQIPGAVAVGNVSAANAFTTIPVFTTTRLCCPNCDTANITLVNLQNASVITNVSVRVVKA